MRLVAKKPCSFEGHKFFIGDEIPESYVENPKSMEKMGVISIVGESGTIHPAELQNYTAQVGTVKFEINIHAKEGDLPLSITNEELSVFTDIRQIDVQKAEDKRKITELIQKVESEDLLIILDALDGRKFVKDEAQARAQELSKENEEDEEDEPGGDE